MSVLLFVVTAIVLPMLVIEFTDWLPWFALHIFRAAARSLPPALRDRYIEEWQAEANAVPGGNISRLIFALRVCAKAPSTGAALRGFASARPIRIKSAFDRMAAASALVLLAPVFTAVALFIKLTDRGPVFSRQTRVGRDGETFTMYGFRTMLADSEMSHVQFIDSNEDDGALCRICKDPRITKIGSQLRHWSLDELPQLFNVLLGDMSMVGPRAALPEEAAQCDDDARPRLAVKPVSPVYGRRAAGEI